jgi:RNA polymerase primary sigma factor
MADIMKMPVQKAKIIHQIIAVLGSVRDIYGQDNPAEQQMFEASLQDKKTGRPEDPLVEDEEKAKAVRLLNEIEPREANILRLHYGLDGNKPLTLKEIGERLKLTRERIRQIQREALTKLYEYMNEE